MTEFNEFEEGKYKAFSLRGGYTDYLKVYPDTETNREAAIEFLVNETERMNSGMGVAEIGSEEVELSEVEDKIREKFENRTSFIIGLDDRRVCFGFLESDNFEAPSGYDGF